MHGDPGTNTIPTSSVAPISTSGESDNQSSTSTDRLPIALRKSSRTRTPPEYLKDYKHDIANYISYKCCSPSLQSFFAPLDSISIPRDWKVALEDPQMEGSNVE
jgi:hypothetical protein